MLFIVNEVIHEQGKGSFPHEALPLFSAKAEVIELGVVYDLLQEEFFEAFDLVVLL